MKTIAEYEQWSLDDILGKFELNAEPAVECRRYPRYEYTRTVEVVVHPLQAGRRPSRCFLLTQDISRGGINLIHAVKLAPGQRLDITLDDLPPRSAVVVWCRQLPSRHYSIGCEFETPLNEKLEDFAA